jgi:hypothetical protein
VGLSVLPIAFLGLHFESEPVPSLLLLGPEALSVSIKFKRLLRDLMHDDDLALVGS